MLEYVAPQPPRGHRRLMMAAAVAAAAGVLAVALVVRHDGRTDTVPVSPSTTANSSASPAVTLPVTNEEPAADAWSRLPDSGLRPRFQDLLVSTTTGLFVWGGYGDGTDTGFLDGAFYDTGKRTWRALPPAPLADSGGAIGVWTGTEVIVANGDGVLSKPKAAAFNPISFTWRPLDDPPVTNASSMTSRMNLVEDSVALFSVNEDQGLYNQVAQLDLTRGTWRRGQAPPVAVETSFDAIAAGNEMIVVGRAHLGTAAGCRAPLRILAYQPLADAWRELPAGPAVNRADPVVVWTGSELFVGGGGSCADNKASPLSTSSAELLNLETADWRSAADAPLRFESSSRYGDTWTGDSVLTLLRDGSPLLYSPATNAWHQGPPLTDGHDLALHSTPAALIGGELIIMGGTLDGTTCCTSIAGTYAYTLPDHA